MIITTKPVHTTDWYRYCRKELKPVFGILQFKAL